MSGREEGKNDVYVFFISSAISGSTKNMSCAQQKKEEERYNCNTVFHWLLSFPLQQGWKQVLRTTKTLRTCLWNQQSFQDPILNACLEKNLRLFIVFFYAKVVRVVVHYLDTN